MLKLEEKIIFITLVHLSLPFLQDILGFLEDRLNLYFLALHVLLFFQQIQYYPWDQGGQQQITLALPFDLSLLINQVNLSDRLFQGFLCLIFKI